MSSAEWRPFCLGLNVLTQHVIFADDVRPYTMTELNQMSIQQPSQEAKVNSSERAVADDVRVAPRQLTTSTSIVWETIQKRQSDRQRLKQERCHANGPWPHLNTQDIETMMVDTKHQAAFCAVAKTASTSWTTKLLELIGHGDVPPADHMPFIRSNTSELTYINNFSPQRGQRIIDSYYTFIFVREPWERLLSCWHSSVKHKTRSYFYKRNGAAHFLSQFSKDQSDKTVPFPEFLDYIATSQNGLATANKHWRPIYLVSIWWRHDKELFSEMLVLCEGIPNHRWNPDCQNTLFVKQCCLGGLKIYYLLSASYLAVQVGVGVGWMCGWWYRIH